MVQTLQLHLPLLMILRFSTLALPLCAGQALQPHTQQNIWESFAPGELLRLLEHSTYTIPFKYNAIAQRRSDENAATPENTIYSTPREIHKRSNTSPATSTDNTYTAEDQLNAPSSAEFNYDQAYEDFVREYFGDKLAEDSDSNEKNEEEALDGEESEEVEQLETEHNSSAETELLTGETKKRTQRRTKEKCRHVKKHKQNCMVCENARTGEKSETCSFSRASEPQRYAFQKETSYKKQRDAEEPSSQSEEQTSAEEAEVAEADTINEKIDNRDFVGKRDSKKPPKDSSTCIQLVKRGKICYQCVDGDGTSTKCYVPAKMSNGSNNRQRPAKGNEHKVQKAQQRIYKRTISYSFEKGTNGTMENVTPIEASEVENTTATISTPHLKEKIFIKVIKQNETIAE
ncbi:uncharacterized protein LOC120773827 [Bactrocera tryoni]|uniref:uncharacterized protein LOC120773827 n=1 Tax=Bactrocera tryoni TaxID=59916 RepID=UPI001A983BCF|nr:uncharacterized protein LOC120773827 [Bactrocera tryoni]